MDCDICCNTYEHEFMTCLTCKQGVCLGCFVKLDSCPFCRSIYPGSFEPENNDSFIYRRERVSIIFRPDQMQQYTPQYTPQYTNPSRTLLHKIANRIRRLLN